MRKKNKKVSLAKKPLLVISRRGMAGWLAVIFVVCAWMFVIGVLVGRGTSPLKIDINELQRKLEVARAELMKKGRGQIRQNSDSGKEKTELEFYEALKKNRDDTEVPSVLSLPSIKKKMDPPPQDTPPKPKKESKKRLTKNQKKINKPVDSLNKNPAHDSRPPSSASISKAEQTGAVYALQVAAFKASRDADGLVAELRQKGFSAYRAIGKVPGKGIWYRVRIGEYKNKAEASQALARLKKEGMKPVLVEK